MYMYIRIATCTIHTQCHGEISVMEREMKELWDMIMIVKSCFEDWNTTLWKDINVENMDADCKKFVKVGIVLLFVHVYPCIFYCCIKFDKLL